MPSKSDILIAERYAKAAWIVANGSPELLKRFKDEFESLSNIACAIGKTSYRLRDKKIAIVSDSLYNAGFCKEMVEFLSLVILKNRLELFGQIYQLFAKYYREHFGAELVEIISATTVTYENNQKIMQILGDKLQKKIELKHSLDQSLISGFVIKVGSKMIDASLKTEIAAITNSLHIR